MAYRWVAMAMLLALGCPGPVAAARGPHPKSLSHGERDFDTIPFRPPSPPGRGAGGEGQSPLSQVSPEPEAPSELDNSPEPETPPTPETPTPETQDIETQDLEAPANPPNENPGAEDDLFEQIFGRPRLQDQASPIPFWINDQRRGQAIVVISGGRASLVQGAPVLAQTRDLLQPDLQAQLEASLDGEGFLSLNQLQQVGIPAIFDQSQLAL